MAKKTMLTAEDIIALLCAWLIDGATQAQIGSALGVTGPAVSYHIRKRGLAKLRGAGEAVAIRILGQQAVRSWQPAAWQNHSPSTASKKFSPRQLGRREEQTTDIARDDLVAIAALGAAFALRFNRAS